MQYSVVNYKMVKVNELSDGVARKWIDSKVKNLGLQI